MVILTDERTEPDFIPTRKNIIRAMKWLVYGAKPGDSLFFHFSGHGGQTVDRSNDESDGMDETIFPVDYQKAGQIVDDVNFLSLTCQELHDIMVKPLDEGVRLTAIFDCCHSGTVLDLPYTYRCDGKIEVKTDKAHRHAAMTLMNAGQLYQKGDRTAAFDLLREGFSRLKDKPKDGFDRKKVQEKHTSTADVVQFAGCKDSQVFQLF